MTVGLKIRFGSPWPPEKQRYIEALGNLLRGSGDFIPKRPPDPLTSFRETWYGRKKQPISLRLDGWIIELTKMMAKQHEIPYQTILRIWIEEGLRRAVQDGIQEEEPSQAEGDSTEPRD